MKKYRFRASILSLSVLTSPIFAVDSIEESKEGEGPINIKSVNPQERESYIAPAKDVQKFIESDLKDFTEDYFTEAKITLKASVMKPSKEFPTRVFMKTQIERLIIPSLKKFEDLWEKGMNQNLFLLNDANLPQYYQNLKLHYIIQNENKNEVFKTALRLFLEKESEKSEEEGLTLAQKEAFENGFKNFKLSEVAQEMSKLYRTNWQRMLDANNQSQKEPRNTSQGRVNKKILKQAISEYAKKSEQDVILLYDFLKFLFDYQPDFWNDFLNIQNKTFDNNSVSQNILYLQ